MYALLFRHHLLSTPSEHVREPAIGLIVCVCVWNRLFPPTAIVHYGRPEESEQSLHCGGLRLGEEE